MEITESCFHAPQFPSELLSCEEELVILLRNISTGRSIHDVPAGVRVIKPQMYWCYPTMSELHDEGCSS